MGYREGSRNLGSEGYPRANGSSRVVVNPSAPANMTAARHAAVMYAQVEPTGTKYSRSRN
jgi:hypothetical protein